MRTTPIILDRLDASLMQHGVRLKRSQLLETAAMAFGYKNSNEFTSAARAGDLNMPHPDVVGRVTVADTPLVAMRDHSGAIYAIEESFLEQVVDQERSEIFGPSPYGGLVDLSDIAGHPATAWADKGHTAAKNDTHGFLAFNGEDEPIGEFESLEDAQNEIIEGEDTKRDLDAYVIDVAANQLLRRRWCWRAETVEPVKETLAARVLAAAHVSLARERETEAKERHETTLRIDVPDWRAWNKSLKKASHKRQEPISDEILHQMRHACADVTSKSSSSEKSEVVHRQARYVEKHLGGLLARLDRAEEALREAGLAPAEIQRKSKEDAAEMLAAIEAVATRRAEDFLHNLYEVDATRDGSVCREIFEIETGQDPENVGRGIAAKEFRMTLDDYKDEEGQFDDFDSECDTFSVWPVKRPEEVGIIADALAVLSSTSFSYGMPSDHPARIKLLAAMDRITPKPTV